jgi:hypothetical protein
MHLLHILQTIAAKSGIDQLNDAGEMQDALEDINEWSAKQLQYFEKVS